MILTPVTDTPQSQGKLDLLPRILHELTALQRHILGRVAVHSWTHQGSIPFIPPNAHQAQAAFALAHPDVRLLLPISLEPSFHITRRGELAVCRLFQVIPWRWSCEQERLFDEMQRFYRNKWETCD